MNWSDPDRTLNRYVQEVQGIPLLDYADDPYLDEDKAQERIDLNEPYDPTCMKTFMAEILNMQR